MAESSERYGLPFILPGQAQKELFHNEALVMLDAALHPAVEDGPLSTPPATPAFGQCWLIGTGATDAWVDRDGQIAAWTTGGWRFIAPQAGMLVWDKTGGFHRRWTGTTWSNGDVAGSALLINSQQVVGPRMETTASPSDGTNIDAEARAAIDAIIVALKTHGLIQ